RAGPEDESTAGPGVVCPRRRIGDGSRAQLAPSAPLPAGASPPYRCTSPVSVTVSAAPAVSWFTTSVADRPPGRPDAVKRTESVHDACGFRSLPEQPSVMRRNEPGV